MREDDDGRQFIAFVQKKRKQQDYTLEQVCEGICSPGTIHSMENGSWKPDKLVRDCTLDRLGAGVEDYEHFLDIEEYGRFEARNSILHGIVFEETDRAEELLEKYRETFDMGNKFERQFCLCMEVQIRSRRGSRREEISALLEEAAALTIPELHRKPLDQLVLSVGELNLVLEAEAYRREGERTEQYRQMVNYIEKKQMDGIARAKIYPKAVYYFCLSLLAEKGGEATERDMEELLQYCGRAVELLRDNAKRLGLPAEYTRSDLITDSAEARELMRQLKRCSGHGSLDLVSELLERIRTLAPMDIRFNRQVLERGEILNHWKKREIDREEYYSKMKAVLELTLPYDAFLKEGEKYLIGNC